MKGVSLGFKNGHIVYEKVIKVHNSGLSEKKCSLVRFRDLKILRSGGAVV